MNFRWNSVDFRTKQSLDRPKSITRSPKSIKKLQIWYPWWSRLVDLVESFPTQCLTSLEALRVSRLSPNSARYVNLVERIPMQCLTSLEAFRVSGLSPTNAQLVDPPRWLEVCCFLFQLVLYVKGFCVDRRFSGSTSSWFPYERTRRPFSCLRLSR